MMMMVVVVLPTPDKNHRMENEVGISPLAGPPLLSIAAVRSRNPMTERVRQDVND